MRAGIGKTELSEDRHDTGAALAGSKRSLSLNVTGFRPGDSVVYLYLTIKTWVAIKNMFILNIIVKL